MNKNNNLLFTISKLPRAVTKKQFVAAFKEEVANINLDIETLEKIAFSIDSSWFPYGAVIDLQRLYYLLEGENAELRKLASLSRVKLQGTDGIRGKVDKSTYTKREALALFLEKGVLSPAFFALNGEAFARYLIDKKGVKPGDYIIVGEDGRDALAGGSVVPSLIKGLNEGGCNVLNCGVIPTPGVPYGSYFWGCRGGVIITASHNPSNQNGIKLLYDSFKLMDDGPISEFGLTKYIYALAEENLPIGKNQSAKDISEKANALLESIILDNINFPQDLAQKAILVYDGANGAFSKMAPKVLKTLPFETYPCNVNSLGYNINQNGGVGELEGTHLFRGDVDEATFDHYFPVIKKMFELGRIPTNPIIFGIVNDGDGDRGYLLVYDKSLDGIHVIPGDELATLIIAKRYLEKKLKKGSILVNSVESDIMAAGYVHKKYNVENFTACVGDKWLLVPAREGLPFAVGCEESGHVTFGVSVKGKNGKKTVYTGNGLLSALTGLEYILKNDLSMDEIVHPFPPGYKKIRYVYFVDKDKFLPGTPAFKEAGQIGLNYLSEKLKPMGLKVKIVDYPDAPEMLYIAAFDKDDIKVGSLFVRNSGTESKTGTAIRCKKELSSIFEDAMNAVHNSNAAYLKNMKMLEARQEAKLIKALNKGPCTKEDFLKLDKDLDQTNLDALLYAMRKEKLITQISEDKWEIKNE